MCALPTWTCYNGAEVILSASETETSMNAMDFIYLLLLLAGLAIGFFNGTIKLLVAIVAFYVSIILASLYFQSLGQIYRVRFQSSLEVAQIMAFITILLFAF